MRRLTIVAVGKIGRGPEAQLCDDYLQRSRALATRLGLHGPQLKEVTAIVPQNIPGVRIACDERGESPDSRTFASWFDPALDAGDVTLLIGPADGFSQADLTACNKRIAFGRMSMPHLLLRAVLCEQVYRALTILSGHPYHRD